MACWGGMRLANGATTNSLGHSLAALQSNSRCSKANSNKTECIEFGLMFHSTESTALSVPTTQAASHKLMDRKHIPTPLFLYPLQSSRTYRKPLSVPQAKQP